MNVPVDMNVDNLNKWRTDLDRILLEKGRKIDFQKICSNCNYLLVHKKSKMF